MEKKMSDNSLGIYGIEKKQYFIKSVFYVVLLVVWEWYARP